MKQPKEHESRPSPVDSRNDGDWNDDLRPLRDRLDALARVERAAAPPPGLEAAVMRAWDRRYPTLRSRVVRWIGAAAAAAALVALAYSARNEPTSSSQDSPTRVSATAVAARSAQQAMTDVVLVGAPPMPGERIQVVRTRIARDVLTTMGVRPVGSDGDMVDIDMLIGEDGVARGLRVETSVR